MAGGGSRFLQEGYQVPKPFITVHGMPMFVAALKSFPKAEQYVFICQKSFLNKFPFAREIQVHFPGSLVLSVDKVTEGQACTCLLAKDHIEQDSNLLISSIDYQLVYDENRFEELSKDPSVDVIVFTFKTGGITKKDPSAFAYCRVEGETVTRVLKNSHPCSWT
jgi:choline kinase